MGDSSASASTSAYVADPSLFGDYEVFLNFCGEDTRYGFTDYLYNSLTRAGIRTFRDDNDLPDGEEIGPELARAINDSKISIPIFSKNYASKKWCLIELTRMVQCRKNRGQKILPIFYDVTPDDVKHQCGSYKQAFHQHSRNPRYDRKVIQEWKDALKIVGQIKGSELRKETGGHEGKLATIITDTVLEILMQNNKHEDSYLVGMASRMEKIEKLLNIQSDGVRFIGIHGMGGLGKTTIAEVIYNKYQHLFDCHSFLPDVRETESRNGIVHLQKQLLLAILKTRTIHVNDYNDGIRKIKGVVGRKKVLIVLDDVNDKSQIEGLAGSWKWFGARSRIIITTRNREVLRALESTKEEGHPEVYRSCQPDYLNPVESLELFCKHAFKNKNPPKDYYTLSKGIASTAAGLPLVLKVTGSSLCGEKEKDLWKERFKELKNIPEGEVQENLRLSFDTLNGVQKEIFLDIACLFIGQDKTNPLYMWDDCGFYPRNVLNVLERRSLITIGDDDILRMHDQLRDLGRQIVREGEGKLDEWGRWSRLWDSDKAFEVYRTGQGTEKVKALCLDRHPFTFESDWEDDFDDSEFDSHDSDFDYPTRWYAKRCRLVGEKFLRLPHLRYLTLDARDTLYGDFEHCLPNLRWLQWRYQLDLLKSITPTNLHLRNLVILDLSFSHITKDSDLWNQIQMLKKLKVLDLFCCNYLRRVPFLSTFSNLERLVVGHCYKLCSLDGVEELESLRYLDATCCYSLKTLPSLSRLTKLEELYFNNCCLITDIPGLDKLESLELLRMEYCRSFERLPDLSNLKRLKKLYVYRTTLTEIRGLGGLKSVEVLDMSRCRYIERVFGLMNLKRLKRLNIQCCPNLIEIHGLQGLEPLGRSLQGTENVKALCLDRRQSTFHKIGVLDGEKFFGPQHLRYLTLDAWDTLYGDFERCLPNLRWLQWSYNGLWESNTLTNLHLRNLVTLDLSNSDIAAYSDLWKQMQMLKKLKVLDLSCCNWLGRVPSLSTFGCLEYLGVNKYLGRVPSLSAIHNLERLVVNKCYELRSLDGVEEWESLRYLDATWCSSLKTLPNLSRLTKLKELKVKNCKLITEIGLGGLKSLEVLNMSNCESIERLFGLEGLESLGCLVMDGCKSIETLRELSKLKSLKALSVNECEKLTEIGGLEELKSLEFLDIGDCKMIGNLPDFSNLRKLEVINATGCVKLTEIRGIENLESFGDLFIGECESLNTLMYSHISRVRMHMNSAEYHEFLADLRSCWSRIGLEVVHEGITITSCRV